MLNIAEQIRLESHTSSSVIIGFCGFSSGVKQLVSISSSAMSHSGQDRKGHQVATKSTLHVAWTRDQ